MTIARATVSLVAAIGPLMAWTTIGVAADASHLVISELVTGGATASDEFIEIYNPLAVDAPLAGLELIYVTASGTTVTRRAAWSEGAIAPHAHVLVANDAGIYRTVADSVYTSGTSASGGSVALRAIGSSTAIDAVGWGNATSTWVEGDPATAAPPGSSLERLPGGTLGSGHDTDDNAHDLVIRSVPEPQNMGSQPTPPIGPGGTPSPAFGDPSSTPPSPLPSAEPTSLTSPGATPSSTASPSAAPSATATPTATAAPTVTLPPSSTATPMEPAAPAPITVATARSLPEGAPATIEGTALSASDFTDGGGFVADHSAGIAVIVSGDTFERGERVRLSGVTDERYHQTTLRADTVTHLGARSEPAAEDRSTGSIGESAEATLVSIRGYVIGRATELTAGLAYELDDGSGAVRVLVVPVTGIDTTGWVPGAAVSVTGVVSQRDSSGHRHGRLPRPSARRTGCPRRVAATVSDGERVRFTVLDASADDAIADAVRSGRQPGRAPADLDRSGARSGVRRVRAHPRRNHRVTGRSARRRQRLRAGRHSRAPAPRTR
ncbi:MAG: lamin tail domain-containing protein [Candidatus Limnocylindria bacterium]